MFGLPNIHSPRLAFSNSLGGNAVCAGITYAAWGVMPLYWKMLEHIPADQIVANRIIWSVVVLLTLAAVSKSWKKVVETIKSTKTLLVLTSTALLLSLDWLIYIFAVQNHLVLQTSLGNFISPLINVAFGTFFLSERLHKQKIFAVIVASIAVLYLISATGTVPWIALALALSFSFYGLLRKLISVDPIVGLLLETLALFPVAIFYLIHCGKASQLGIMSDWKILLLVIASGAITAIPFLFFGRAVQGLRISTLGFFQYITPSCQLLIAILLFGEPFTMIDKITFGLIWIALAIYAAPEKLGVLKARFLGG
jgi:chloramphenicol-sensitive protein RarD